MTNEPAGNPAPSAPPLWASLIATFFGIGRMHPAPGSWASALTVAIWWLVSREIASQWQAITLVVITLGVISVGIPAATAVARASHHKDPQIVVIDEVAGQFLTFIAIAVSWQSLLLGFILFRGFDIVKPPPLRRLEQLRGGIGIVADDLGAGLYSLLIMLAVRHYGLLPR